MHVTYGTVAMTDIKRNKFSYSPLLQVPVVAQWSPAEHGQPIDQIMVDVKLLAWVLAIIPVPTAPTLWAASAVQTHAGFLQSPVLSVPAHLHHPALQSQRQLSHSFRPCWSKRFHAYISVLAPVHHHLFLLVLVAAKLPDDPAAPVTEGLGKYSSHFSWTQASVRATVAHLVAGFDRVRLWRHGKAMVVERQGLIGPYPTRRKVHPLN